MSHGWQGQPQQITNTKEITKAQHYSVSPPLNFHGLPAPYNTDCSEVLAKEARRATVVQVKDRGDKQVPQH